MFFISVFHYFVHSFFHSFFLFFLFLSFLLINTLIFKVNTFTRHTIDRMGQIDQHNQFSLRSQYEKQYITNLSVSLMSMGYQRLCRQKHIYSINLWKTIRTRIILILRYQSFHLEDMHGVKNVQSNFELWGVVNEGDLTHWLCSYHCMASD